MANSKYAYVRDFELPNPLLPGVYMLFRLDGHSFHRFSDQHGFVKPNDIRALNLMDCAAKAVMEEYPDIVLGFGESDEYSFLLRKATTLYNRRQSKIVSTLTSYFTSCYVFHWPKYFPDVPLQYPPSFDGRIVLYPTKKHVRDYFAWRQADTHINNLYNTTFWALVQQGGQTTTEAHATLRGTFSKDKNEILFSRFSINYSRLDAQLRKGSLLVRTDVPRSEQLAPEPSFEGGSDSLGTPDASTHASSSSTAKSPLGNEGTADVAASAGSTNGTEVQLTTGISLKDEIHIADDDLNLGPPADHLNEPVFLNVTADSNPTLPDSVTQKSKSRTKNKKTTKQQARKTVVEVIHTDIIGDEFWIMRPDILEGDD